VHECILGERPELLDDFAPEEAFQVFLVVLAPEHVVEGFEQQFVLVFELEALEEVGRCLGGGVLLVLRSPQDEREKDDLVLLVEAGVE